MSRGAALLGACWLGLLAFGVRIQARRHAPLSDAWWRDHMRRSGCVGLDQSPIRQWPINKLHNEASAWNSQRLRQRASR